MKKTFNAILVMGLFLMTGYFLVPVYAEGGTEEVIIQDVRQNNTVLEHSGNTYQITDYRYNPQVLFYVKNAKKNTYYNVYFYSNEEDYAYSTIYNKSNNIEYYEKSLNLYAANSNYTIKLCTTDGAESETCVNEIGTKTLTLSYADYNKINFDDMSLMVTKVMQGGVELEPTVEYNSAYYNISSLDDIEISLKGTNFDNTLTYEIDVNDNKMYYSGSLLNDGITISSYPVHDEYLYITAVFPINNQLLNIKCEYEEELYNVNFNFDAQKNNNLKYTVTPSAPHIDPVAYQNNKVINFRLKASTFEDRDYLAKVYVSYLSNENKATVVYSEEKTINGLVINNGYDYTISGVTLPAPYNPLDIGSYLVTVVIENNVRSNSFFYKANGTIMTSNVYYGDHTTLLRPLSGMGYPVMSKDIHMLNMLLPNSNKIYIQFSSASSAIEEEDWIDFVADKEYNYVLSRGYRSYYAYGENLIYEETLKTGTVMGDDINNGNLVAEITVPANTMASGYEEVYQMVIYDGDVAVTYVRSIINRNYNPPIASYELKSNNQVLNERGYNDYLIPNEFDLTMQLNGYGFDEEKEYKLNLFETRTNMRSCFEDCGERFETTIPHDEIIVSGKDLNDGYLLTLSANEDDNVKYGDLSLAIADGVDTIFNDYFSFEFYDKDKEEIEIVSVMQDNTELTKQNGKYVITDPSKRITLKYKFKNIKDGKTYDYSFTTFENSNNVDYYDMTLDNTTVRSERLFLNPNASETSYTIHLCKNNQEHSCTKEWDSKRLDFVLNDYEEYDYENSKILVTKVMQGGVEVTPTRQDGYYYYNLNDVENVILSVKGENLKSDANYYVGYTGSPYMEWRYISGATLMEGLDVTVTLKTNAYVTFEASLPAFPTWMEPKYRQNGDIYDVAFYIVHDEEVPDYQFDVTYKDELACIQTYKGSVNIDPATYVNKNGIDVLISGTNYEDKDYSINVKVLNRSNEVVYNENNTVNGLDLNTGYRYYLNNLEFLPRESIQDFGNGYYIVVTVNNATSQIQVLYNSTGTAISKIYYNNGIEVIRNADNPYKIMNYKIMYLDRSIINQNNEITLEYFSNYDSFNYGYLYNYELVKGKMVYEYLSDLTNKETLYSGTVRGSVLNDTGLAKTIVIPNDMANDDAYMMIIKNGNEIVSYDIVQFRFTDDAMFIVNKLYDGEEEITNPQKGYDINYYHDTRLHLMTIGLDDNKEYTLRFVKNSNLDEQNVTTNVTVSGSELNSGYDYLMPAVANEEMTYADMSLTLLDDGNTIDTLYYTLFYVEKYLPHIMLRNIKSVGQPLQEENNKFVVTTFDYVEAEYNVVAYDPSREYYIKSIGGTDIGNVSKFYPDYQTRTIAFSRSQIEGEYTLDPICPVVDGYNFVSRNGLLCTYTKPSTMTSNPICPVVEGYDFILYDGNTCNYQMEYEVQVGEEYDPEACDDEGCNGAYVPVYETRFDYITRDVICESGELSGGLCVTQTTSNIVRDVVCQNGTLQGDKCVVDTSDGYNGNYTFIVCADEECNHPYDSLTFTLSYQMPELVNRSTLEIQNITQGGRVITLDEHNRYNVNSLETVEFTLKATNLVSDKVYHVGNWYHPILQYTGSELNKGVQIKIYDEIVSNYDSLALFASNSSNEVVYPTNEHGDRVYLSYYDDNNITDFTYELSYLNHQDETVNRYEYSDYQYYFNSNYFNSSNPLKVRINSNVPDTSSDYNVHVSIIKDGHTYYDNTETIKGNRLTSGYEYFINNLDLPLVTAVGENNEYQLNIEVNSVSHSILFTYSSIGNNPSITDRVYYKNDKEHLQAGKGNGGYNWGGPIYDVSDRLFTDHNHVYIKYMPVTAYQDDVTYTYQLEYFERENLWNIEDRTSTILKSGTIKGSDFNTYGLVLEISNPNNYNIPSYGLVIKNGSEVLYMAAPGLELKPIVTFTSIRVMANNTDATFDGNKYIIPRDRTVYGIISGIGFDDDKEYTINLEKSYYANQGSENSVRDNDLIILSGYDLNHDGVKFTIDTDVDDQYTYVTYGSGYNDSADVYFRDAIYIQYREPDPEIGEFEAAITYHGMEKEVYYVEPIKFNESGLDLLINGESFQDKKYPVAVRILSGENSIYEKQIEVEGLNLNQGYPLSLDELSLDYATTIPEFEYSGYSVEVIVNGVQKNYFFSYNSRGEVIPRVYYNNTEKEAKAVAGSGEVFADYRILRLNRNILNRNDQLTIKYQGYMFDNNKNYTYEFVKGMHLGNMFEELTAQSVLGQGTVSGEVLNNTGIIKKINVNPSTYEEDERYLLIIRSGDEIVHYAVIGFVIADNPMITNYDILVDQNVITKNRDVYLLNFHTDATAMINGVEFVDNKDYRINITEYYEDYCEDEENCPQKTFEYILKGSKLNNGFEYHIVTNDNEEVDSKYIEIVVTDIALDEEVDWTTIQIRYATPVYFFDEETTYLVDEENSVLKDVKKETEVQDFIDNITPYAGISFKLFDVTGEIEITNNIVGTGMLLKVLDEETYESFFVPIAIKGDITGDGHVSITDLVKVKKHIVDVNPLAGVYMSAGDVTNTGDISVTDFIKIARDIAKIEELG